MLGWIHVRWTVKEIEIGNECEKKTGIKRGTGTGLEKEKGIGTGTEIVIVIEIVHPGETVAVSVPPEERAVEGAHGACLSMLTMAIGRWRREWDCEKLPFVLFSIMVFSSFLCPKTMQYQHIYCIRYESLLLYFYPCLNC